MRKIYCVYRCESWYIKDAPVRYSLLGMLQSSDPRFKIEIINTSDKRRTKIVSICEVELE